MKTFAIIGGLALSLLLSACTHEAETISEKKTENQVTYSYTGEDGSQKIISKRTEYYDPAGFIVRNVEYCNIGHKGGYGYYDWFDYNPDYSIKEAGCFDPKSGKLDESMQTLYDVLSDKWGTYYGDKEGGAYNVRRITTATGAEEITLTASGYGNIRIIKAGGEYFLYGSKLEGLQDINMLQGVPRKVNAESPYVLLTDYYHPIIWIDRNKVPLNTDGVYEKEPGLIVNKTDCVMYYPTGSTYPGLDIKDIPSCDPETAYFLSGSTSLIVDKNGCYTREQKLEGCNPKTINNVTYSPENQYDTSAWKKMKYGTEFKQVMYMDGKNYYDSEGNILESK